MFMIHVLKKLTSKNFTLIDTEEEPNAPRAFESISQQFENRYPPQKFNIYVFYFTDGDNWDNDNEKVVKIIQEKFPQGVVNFVGITQICSYSNENSVKEFIDKKINSNELDAEHIRTAEVGSNLRNGKMSEDDRNSQILDAIKKLLSVEA